MIEIHEDDTYIFHVLDKGFVRLVDYMGGDISIVRAARVSYNAAWRAGEDEGSDRKLIKYLYKNKHTTPFESVTFTFEVKAPIFVLRQWHRHRTWSYNELSGRYRELSDEFYVPDPNKIGIQDTKNKQSREVAAGKEFLQDRLYELALYTQECKKQFETYQTLLKQNWPRELARCVLPLSTYSHMFAIVNLHNLLHFIRLRDHDHAQYEIREYAKAIKQLITPIVPVTMEAFDEQSNAARTQDR